jgi:hypothetical protein
MVSQILPAKLKTAKLAQFVTIRDRPSEGEVEHHSNVAPDRRDKSRVDSTFRFL